MKTITLSVNQFNTFVKNILDAEEFLSNICVYGEVTNFKMSGGHAYFDLKDETAMLSCVKFGASDLNIKNGDLVTAFGKVNFYVKSGRLNFLVGRVTTAGMGDLYQRFLMLKQKLEKEGFFAEEIKKPIPRFAKNLGVVTSETGAVIRDIMHRLKKSNDMTKTVKTLVAMHYIKPSKENNNEFSDRQIRRILSKISLPVSLSSSYFFLLPFSISTTAIKSSGEMRLGEMSCHMFDIFSSSFLFVCLYYNLFFACCQ